MMRRGACGLLGIVMMVLVGCFRAIPAAHDAVGDRGRLVGVRRRSHRDVARRFPGVTAPPNSSPICLVAFQGDYKPGEVRGTTDGGRYAIVVVDARSKRVLNVRVTDKLPLRFRHRV